MEKNRSVFLLPLIRACIEVSQWFNAQIAKLKKNPTLLPSESNQLAFCLCGSMNNLYAMGIAIGSMLRSLNKINRQVK